MSECHSKDNRNILLTNVICTVDGINPTSHNPGFIDVVPYNSRFCAYPNKQSATRSRLLLLLALIPELLERIAQLSSIDEPLLHSCNVHVPDYDEFFGIFAVSRQWLVHVSDDLSVPDDAGWELLRLTHDADTISYGQVLVDLQGQHKPVHVALPESTPKTAHGSNILKKYIHKHQHRTRRKSMQRTEKQ
jgi:hypothetical protein